MSFLVYCCMRYNFLQIKVVKNCNYLHFCCMTSNELKAERKKRGLTQAKFAELLGVKKGTVTAWEIGQNPIPEWIKKRLKEEGRMSVNPSMDLKRYKALSEIADKKGTDVDNIVMEAISEYNTG